MKRTPFIWTPLDIHAPLKVTAVRGALTALATMAGQPLIVLETSGNAHRVSWRLGCQTHTKEIALAALRPHLPNLQTGSSTIDRSIDTAAKISVARDRNVGLNVDVTESVARSLLGALSAAKKSETISIQIVLGPRYRPSVARSRSTSASRPEVTHAALHAFGCAIRIGAKAGDPARSRSLINRVAAALRGLEAPGVRVRLTSGSPASLAEARTPWLWPDRLSVDDIAALVAWPVGELPLPGVPSPHPKLIAPSPVVPKVGRLLGDATASRTDRPIAMKRADARRHLHALGPSGVGKSTLLARISLNSLSAGEGGLVVDPIGDLAENILQRVPQDRIDDIAVLDPRDFAPLGIAALSGDPDLAADAVLSIFHSMYPDLGPRSSDILFHVVLTLAKRGDCSLLQAPLLLTNPGFRRSVIGRVVKADPMGLGTFWGWFEGISDSERQAAIAPIMNKLRFLQRPAIRGVLGQRAPKFSFNDIFTKKKFLIVNLSKGTVGQEAAAALGSIVVSSAWNAALARVAVPVAERSPVTFIIDELQDYIRIGDLADAMVQSRNLAVNLVVANQHLGQLSPSIKSAIMANAQSRIAFALGASDAREIAMTTRGELTHEDFQSLPAFQAYASLLVDGTTAPWLSLTTRPLPKPIRPSAEVRNRSREQYGQPLDEIERDLLDLIEPQPAASDDPIGRVRRPRPGDQP